MSEMGEVARMVEAIVPERNICPFEHGRTEHEEKNKTDNDATKLKSALGAEHVPDIDITLPILPDGKRLPMVNGEQSTKGYGVQFSAHHLVPGNESWPKSGLYKWMDEKGGNRHVNADIGYDVNARKNGVALPSHCHPSALSGWTTNPAFRKEYAVAAMKADSRGRQFHDSHRAYSRFVIQCLNKIAAELEARPGGSAGCQDEKCPGKRKEPPFDPPYMIMLRLEELARRLSERLVGSVETWEIPLMTSKFALIFQKNLSEQEAREALKVKNVFKLEQPKV